MKKDLTVKNNLKVARISRNLSQQELAKLCGTTQATISAIESGKYSCTLKLGLILSVALNVPVNELFWLDVC